MNELILIFIVVRVPWGEAWPAVVSDVTFRTEVVVSTDACSASSRVVEGVGV